MHWSWRTGIYQYSTGLSKPCTGLKFRISYNAQSVERFFINDLGRLTKNQDELKIFYVVVENLPTVTVNHLSNVLLKHSDLLKEKCPYLLLSIWISLSLSLFLFSHELYNLFISSVKILCDV